MKTLALASKTGKVVETSEEGLLIEDPSGFQVSLIDISITNINFLIIADLRFEEFELSFVIFSVVNINTH